MSDRVSNEDAEFCAHNHVGTVGRDVILALLDDRNALTKQRDEFESEGIELNRRLNDALNKLQEWQDKAEKAEAEVERLREMLLAERALSGRLCGALEYIDDYCLSYPDLGVLSGVATPAIQDHEQATLQRKEGG